MISNEIEHWLHSSSQTKNLSPPNKLHKRKKKKGKMREAFKEFHQMSNEKKTKRVLTFDLGSCWHQIAELTSPRSKGIDG